MKLFWLSILILLSYSEIYGQVLKGQIVDSKTNEPLEYVSIGIINTPFGTISDDKGYFEFEYNKQDLSSIVRISMIGFEPQTFPISDLLQKDNKIKMVETSYVLNEVVIKPTKNRVVGANGFNKFQGWSGWGGLHVRKGYEIGIKLDLGEKSFKIKSLHVLLQRQAFDTSLFRLHIRTIKDTLVLDELLKGNIIITFTNESGWANIDLEQYNLIMSGEIGLTLEWLKVMGINEDREMKINDRKQKAYILFKNKKNQTGLYRWGTEAKWIINKEKSPSMYLTIME
jgi:hypothetical protein